MHPPKVLVVEDTRSISLFMRNKIESELHFETEAAYTFEEARQILDRSTDFFVAVLDLNLPDAPRGEIVDFVLSRQVPAIILTATLDESIREGILARNVVDYVIKQNIWSVEYVVRIIDRIYRNQSIKVLVVDDTPSFRQHFRMLLETQRFSVLEANDGQEGLELIQKHPDIKLILTDYNMPRMDGFQFVSQVRKQHSKDQLAIIGLSAEASGVLPAKFLKLGANDFLKKPFVTEELHARVTQNIEMLELIGELKEAAIKDHLTKLFNRRYCLEAGRKLFSQCMQEQRPFSIALLDIDFFKRINDTYGHDAGDMALKRLAETLRETCSHCGMASRFGGEEFCLVAANTDRKAAEVLFEHIRQRVERQEVHYGGQTIRFTVSIGVSTYPLQSLEEMIKRADEMLYQAKREGRNRVIMEPTSISSLSA